MLAPSTRDRLASRADFEAGLTIACASTAGRHGLAKRHHTALLMVAPDSLLLEQVDVRLLQAEVAKRLCSVARTDDLVCSLGGGVFAVLCQKVVSDEVAFGIAARVHSALADTFQIDGVIVPMQSGIGIAIVGMDADDANGLMSAASAALISAKRAGQATTRFSPDRLGDSAS